MMVPASLDSCFKSLPWLCSDIQQCESVHSRILLCTATEINKANQEEQDFPVVLSGSSNFANATKEAASDGASESFKLSSARTSK